MDLTSVRALMAIVTRPCAALWGRAQSAAVKNRRCRLGISAGRLANELAGGFQDLFLASGHDPALMLLVNRLPPWKVMGEIPPGAAGTHDVPHAVVGFAQIVLSLGRIRPNQLKKGSTNAHSSSETSLG